MGGLPGDITAAPGTVAQRAADAISAMMASRCARADSAGVNGRPGRLNNSGAVHGDGSRSVVMLASVAGDELAAIRLRSVTRTASSSVATAWGSSAGFAATL